MKNWLQKLLLYIAGTVIGLTCVVLFSWLVRATAKGEEWVPYNLSRSLNYLSTLPEVVIEAVEGLDELPLIYVKTEEDFEPLNLLEEDIKVLTSYAHGDWKRTIALINLRTGEELKTWEITRLANSHNRIVHPVMLPDSSLIYALQGVSGLIKIDKNGERLWKQAQIGHHHAINLGHDGSVWANTYWKDGIDYLYYGGTFNFGGREMPFLDNSITQLNPEDGSIIYHKSVAEIMLENDLGYLLVKSNTPGDPLHINDIQPVLHDGPKFKRGDVFISGRSGSWILHFRPSTGKVIEVITGPFESQHDVDIESDSTITFFNNNSQSFKGERPNKWRIADDLVEFPMAVSGLVRYYLGEHRFERVEQEVFDENSIFTFTEGLHEKLPGGGYFIEEQNSSVWYVIKDGKAVYRDVLKSHHEGYHHLSNWARWMP